MSTVLGIVPVEAPDPDQPDSCSALTQLRGPTLVARAVGALLRSGLVTEVRIATDPVMAAGVTEAVLDVVAAGAGADPVPVRIGVRERPRRAAALADMVREAELSDDDIVVLHDPLYPLAPAALVRLVVQALHDHPAAAAAVPVRQVTDTLKRLDEQDVVETTVDRASHRMVFSPQAYRVRALLAALSETGAAAGSTAAGEGDLQVHTLPERVQATGGRLVPVPAPGEVFRVGHRDDLALVEAMVQVGADVDEDPAARPEGVSRGPARS